MNPSPPYPLCPTAHWPADAPRGAVSTFCAEHDVTRKTFYAIQVRARDEGHATALEPHSHRIVVTVLDRDGAVFAGSEGEVIAEYSWPPAGTKYVRMSQARTRFRK